MTPSNDRYAYLRHLADTTIQAALVETIQVARTVEPATAQALDGFIDELTHRRVLDRLTEADAETVAGLIVLDFLDGPLKMGRRAEQVLNSDPAISPFDNLDAAASTLIQAVTIYMIGATAPPGITGPDRFTCPLGINR
jgi:hypothetical protein